MVSTANDKTPAYLGHEYRTPVNHIVGYSELLIDESQERHLEAWVPAFGQIRQSGRNLLEAIQSAFQETAGQQRAWKSEAFRNELASQTEEISGILASVTTDLN